VTAPAGAVECPLDVRAELGEGPVWDFRAARLYFVDILRGLVHQYDPALGESRVYDVHTMVGAVAPTDSGGLVLAVRDGFARLDLDTGRVRPIAAVESARPDARMNDGKCDPAGRFWAGTMALDERPNAGALYRLDPDGGVRTMLRGVTVSNGLDWSADGRLMYFIDTPTQSVDVFDFDVATGTIANRRTMVRIPPDEGAPDGLTLDADDGIWVSLWAGGAVHRYAPDGTLDRVLRLPVTHPTSCAFGGGDLGDLYITTATVALTSDERKAQPFAGRLFRCRPGPRGRAAHRFAGL
jgi:sugar lactone lactonase YvrE